VGEAEKLWETMNSVGRLRVILEAKDEEIHRERDRTSFQVVWRSDPRTILTLFGDVLSRENLLPEEEHPGVPIPPRWPDWFWEEEKDWPFVKALILERATELSSQKAGRVILPQNQECTVSPEVVKRLVHHLREEEKKAEEIPEKKWQPTQKKLPRHRKRRRPCPP
jgi:hypothetical protein